MSTDTDLAYATIEELAPQIAARQISPVALTQSQLDRIAKLNPTLDAYVTLMADSALAEAKAAESAIAAGDYRGPLHGVPLAVKDLCFTAGVATAGGTAVRRDFIPQSDGTVVARLRAAGAVLLGKLALTEGAMGGYHPDLPIPKNPWNADLWTGVSSSGSGVATASGQCYGSLGSDTGGSIRFPSAACGIVGLKPSYGRVSRAGVLALAESLDHVGPMTRSTWDAAAMLSAIAGPDPADPTSRPDPVPDYTATIDDGIAGLRIGLDPTWALDRVDPGIAAAVEAAIETMRGLGAEIVDITLPDMASAIEQWPLLCSVEAAAAHADTYPSRAGEYGPYFGHFLRLGAAASGIDYARGHIKRLELVQQIADATSGIDVLISPAMATPPFPVTRDFYLQPPGDFPAWRMRFSVPFDFNGWPTITLPAGRNAEGTPLAVQFAGKPLSEELLFRIGRAYERATDYRPMRPPVD
ncbi:MAG: amidase [Chloroflexi bacterium]|nr:MAG: amidase [Chloroflexota bacterium]